MKKYLLCLFCIGILCCRCKKEVTRPTDPLMGKWQFYQSAITRSGPDACQYRTKPSDLYERPYNSYCEGDNVWDFAPGGLTIYYGRVKCLPGEPEQEVRSYQRTDSSLTISGRTYRIVLLSNDTLILDECHYLNNPGPGMPPIGLHPVRTAAKYFRVR